jgi:hypothetical protein
VAPDSSNPQIRRGIWWFDDSHSSHKQPRYSQFPFSPYGIYSLTGFAHGNDNGSSNDLDGNYAGKVTHPSGAPHNNVLLVWTPGPAYDLRRPENTPTYDGGIYVIEGGQPVDDHRALMLIKMTRTTMSFNRAPSFLTKTSMASKSRSPYRGIRTMAANMPSYPPEHLSAW